MDTEMIYCLAILVASLLLIFYKSSTNRLAKQYPKGKPPPPLPPSPPSLPIIGHLHLLKDPHHRSLHNLSSKYGPTLYLRMGNRRLLVISSPKAAEDCLTKSNDITFANRPDFLPGKIMGYNWSSIVWSPYGDHWRNLRRLLTLQVFSTQSIQRLGPIRSEEIRFMLKEILESPRVDSCRMKVEVNQAVFRLTRCVMMRVVTGKRWVKGPFDELFLSSPFMTVYDFFPILRWVFGFKGVEKMMMERNKIRNLTLDPMIDEVRRRGSGDGKMGNLKTVLEQLVELQRVEPEYYTDDIIKSIMVLMFTAGTDTLARTMEWTMSLLLNHPTTLQKARSEIDTHILSSSTTLRLVNESDLSSFPYLHCIINETLRLFPVTPLLVPHCSSSDTTVGEYHVPKNTVLLINAWAIHRDPTVWNEPDKFKPERFMDKESDDDDDGFKFIPFGAGRRGCPGVNLSMRTMSLGLATLIHCFDWERIKGSEPVDLSEETGGTGAVTTPKSVPLLVVCKVRSGMDRVPVQSLSLVCATQVGLCYVY